MPRTARGASYGGETLWQGVRPWGSALRFGVTAYLCLRRLRDPACDYCSLVDVALHQILAVMITTT